MRHCAALFFVLLLFSPVVRASGDAPVSRAQFAAALWAGLGAIPFDANSSFPDVSPSDENAAAISWLSSEGLIQGTGCGLFSPERPITREEAAVLLRRTARWLEWPPEATFTPDGLAGCNDYEGISPWADDSLYWTCTTGLMDWSPGGLLDPQGTLSSASLADILERFFSL